MLEGTPIVRRLSLAIGTASLIAALSGCGTTSSTTMTSSSWSPPRGLVVSPHANAGSQDPAFQAWLATRNEGQLNPEPALPSQGRSWVEVREWDTVRTINGRPRDYYRRTTRTWEAGRRR